MCADTLLDFWIIAGRKDLCVNVREAYNNKLVHLVERRMMCVCVAGTIVTSESYNAIPLYRLRIPSQLHLVKDSCVSFKIVGKRYFEISYCNF